MGAADGVGSVVCLLPVFVAGLVIFVVPGPAARQAAERAAIVALLEQRRFLHAVDGAQAAQRRFGVWPDGAVLQAVAELLLWRVDAAVQRLSIAAAAVRRSSQPAPPSFSAVSQLAMRLGGLPGEGPSPVPPAAWSAEEASLRALARQLDDAREGRWVELRERAPLVLTGLAAPFSPLSDALWAWAHEPTRPASIDHVTLLGETGVAQIAAVWPELAEFISRTPTGNSRVSPLGGQLPVVVRAQ